MQARAMPTPIRTTQRNRAVLAGVLVLLAACAPTTRPTLPGGEASFAGRIAARQAETMLVVATTVQPAGSDRASVRLHAGTRVLHASGASATQADLQVGRQVRAWFDGPVMESYPVQATAGVVVIDP
jgi:hypothetical protein